MTPEALLRRLDDWGIPHETERHRAIFTVEQSKAIRPDPTGGFTKNLFLRSKKKRNWLLTCHEDRRVDLRALARHLGAGNLSLASPERLMEFLGVIPGAVTPLAVVNDCDGAVTMTMDAKLLDYDVISVHPLDNAMTTRMATSDLLRFLERCGHRPEMVDFDAL